MCVNDIHFHAVFFYYVKKGGLQMYEYNPYLNPYLNMYQQNQQPQIQQMPKQEVVKVNGENGARAYPLGANSSALLLDESGTMVWLAVSDGAGYRTVSAYDITPHQTAPVQDYSSLESRISRLEEMLSNGNTTDTTATRRKNSKPTNGTDGAD